MKKIAFLVGVGLLTLIGSVGCEEEHEHRQPYGGTYNGYYEGYGHGYNDYNGGGYRHDDDDYWRHH